jgi:uncharacterized protein (TIGR02284 family)
VQDSQLRSLFEELSEQRAQFARELEMEVSRLGGDVERSGSIAGAAHRGWMSLKSSVTSDPHAIIAECERGEDSAVRQYQEALEEDLPSEIRVMVERQYRQVQAAHDRVRALELRTEGKRGTDRIRKSGA